MTAKGIASVIELCSYRNEGKHYQPAGAHFDQLGTGIYRRHCAHTFVDNSCIADTIVAKPGSGMAWCVAQQ